MRPILTFLVAAHLASAAEPDFPLTADSKAQPEVPKGTMIKDTYTAKEGSVFPGTQREYQIYLPAGHDKTKPTAFMVFQDGVIYQAPVVFDNLIAKKDIPPLVGLFIKPGVVPAANDNALPRFNRSYEYDSITPTYSQFLIQEFLPAIEAKHGLKLSTDPNHAAISGNSSGGICAFMVAWHRPDRFRRVFTGVGTYVGIHGADQLPVLVRKFEPKPLRVFLQSGTGDNNLYCGDWWMANQMMERSLTWAGYDVNHAWGEGGHNQKHASQIFPEVLRWLWRDWQTNIEVKANPKGESKWKGYEVVGDVAWEKVDESLLQVSSIASNTKGEVLLIDRSHEKLYLIAPGKGVKLLQTQVAGPRCAAWAQKDTLVVGCQHPDRGTQIVTIVDGEKPKSITPSLREAVEHLTVKEDGTVYFAAAGGRIYRITDNDVKMLTENSEGEFPDPSCERMILSPDQTLIYGLEWNGVGSVFSISKEHGLGQGQAFHRLEKFGEEWSGPAGGLCVDTNGWLYVATSLGIQVCDQAGRVNFIIPTPQQPLDVCFGGKDLSELFIACGDAIYKRPTKARGVVSGQQSPINPAPPKL